MAEEKTVITLICERAADVNDILDKSGNVQSVPGLKAIKLPCSGMIQPLMIEAALKAGAAGVIVCGCQIGDCYFREGNRMIRERLLGERPPNLKKTVDRRRVTALWLSRLQRGRFESEAKEFIAYVKNLDDAKPAPAKVEPAKPAAKAEEKPAAKAEEKAAAQTEEKAAAKSEEKAAAKSEEKAAAKSEEKAAKAEEKSTKSKDKAKSEGEASDKEQAESEEKKE